MKFVDLVVGAAAGYCLYHAVRTIASNWRVRGAALSGEPGSAYSGAESPAASGVPPRRHDGDELRDATPLEKLA
jgi:hypothetical protein